jgi:hypothetical protein
MAQTEKKYRFKNGPIAEDTLGDETMFEDKPEKQYTSAMGEWLDALRAKLVKAQAQAQEPSDEADA